MLSARNQFGGEVKSIITDKVMAEVTVSAGGLDFVALISNASAKNMGLKAGDEVAVVVKATEVMIAKGKL